jgi:hypothetical protein
MIWIMMLDQDNFSKKCYLDLILDRFLDEDLI